MADGDVDRESTPPLRPRPHEADHGDSRLGVIKRGVGCTGCLLLTSLMSRNYNVKARDKFPLPPCPDELDYPSVWELKVAEAAYSVARDRVAAERERWIEREQVKDKEREEELRRVELERKRKEEEEQAEWRHIRRRMPLLRHCWRVARGVTFVSDWVS